MMIMRKMMDFFHLDGLKREGKKCLNITLFGTW
jgi:hypothetical protein